MIIQSSTDAVAKEFNKIISSPRPPIKTTLNKAVNPVILNIALIKSIMFGIFLLKTAKITPLTVLPAGSYKRTLKVMIPRFLFSLFLLFLSYINKNHNKNKHDASYSENNLIHDTIETTEDHDEYYNLGDYSQSTESTTATTVTQETEKHIIQSHNQIIFNV